MATILRDWKSEIEGAGELSPTHFRVIGRFFDDWGIDAKSRLAESIIRVDSRICDCTHR